ncbi:hypothetical protein [Pinirhizobacter soli]|uniref:hypothetical protein n=1 Tax=Pinirhizobacter soli TaxID=2786953 RepID=UPI00202A9C98|nr:hypothetical protein [Pinirhizobacter soli]
MPAHSENFPWPSYYGHFQFFENRMREHSAVASLGSLGRGLYELALRDGRLLKVFICECYAFGAAEYFEAVQELGNVDAVIISSNWCHYSLDIKRDCRQERVGVFSLRDFMAAINFPQFWLRLTKLEQERFKELGWL